METKTCSKCGEAKALDGFVRQRGRMMGVSGVCKACRNKRQKELREQNPERNKAYKKKYYWSNPEKFRAAARAYVAANYEKVKQRRLYRRDKELEYRRNYYLTHKETEKARAVRWRLQNPDKYKAIMARSTKKATELGIRRTDKWRQERRDWFRENKHKSRAYAKRQCELLTNAYVAHALTNKSQLKAREVKHLIDIKRRQLQIHRAIKTQKQIIKEVSNAE